VLSDHDHVRAVLLAGAHDLVHGAADPDIHGASCGSEGDGYLLEAARSAIPFAFYRNTGAGRLGARVASVAGIDNVDQSQLDVRSEVAGDPLRRGGCRLAEVGRDHDSL
jgi:hypothetical protein